MYSPRQILATAIVNNRGIPALFKANWTDPGNKAECVMESTAKSDKETSPKRV